MPFNSINVMSRYEMMRYTERADAPCVIISISGKSTPDATFAYNPNVLDVLRLRFGDIDDEHADESDGIMTELDAEAIASFVSEHADDGADLFVHCNKGVSRSAGCAAAIMLAEDGDASAILDDAEYRPNMHCFSLTLEALGVPIDASLAQMIEDKRASNKEAWDRENDEFEASLEDFGEVNYIYSA